LVIFFPFWYFAPRKIWQPCPTAEVSATEASQRGSLRINVRVKIDLISTFYSRDVVRFFPVAILTDSDCRVARFFLAQRTKTGKNIPKKDQKHIQYTNCSNVPNGHKVYQNFLLQGLIKIGIFGLKIYHLATLNRKSRKCYNAIALD
jgi:hypothetical protein